MEGGKGKKDERPYWDSPFKIVCIYKGSSEKPLEQECAIAAFSDHIVISFLYDRDGFDSIIECIFYVLIDLCRDAMNYGILLRGAITKGLLYHKGQVILGEALVEAYNLESKEAKYPRIILSPSIAEIVSPEQIRNIKMDSDGFYFIDWLEDILGDRLNNFETKKEYQNIIELNLNKHINNSRIIAKWRWFANYYNQIIKQYGSIEEQEKLLINV